MLTRTRIFLAAFIAQSCVIFINFNGLKMEFGIGGRQKNTHAH